MISLPLEKQAFLANFSNKQMVLARNQLPGPRIDRVGQVVFFDGGNFSGDLEGSYVVADGQIELRDKYGKPTHCFRGAETRNGSTFLVGEPYQEAHFAGFVRCLLYEYKPLTDFRICISTHQGYLADTMPRLVQSLVRVKFPKEKILVVVGSANEAKEGTIEGYKAVFVKENFGGLTALVALPQDYDGYWLAMHDTSEVADDFMARMVQIDVGLNFDRIPILDDIGLYSSAFIKRLAGLGVFEATSKDPLRVRFCPHCRLWSLVEFKSRHVSTKDVYGNGTKREVVYLDGAGLKKYRSKGVAGKA